MKVVILQHVAFEGPARLASFLSVRHDFRVVRLDLGEPLPPVDGFDWLISLGGPMSVHDTAAYPWIVAEQALIRGAVAAGRRVLGICLGAQQIAAALGGRVVRNPCREIGWFPVRRAKALEAHPLGGILPESFDAFHWHGETFSLPEGAVPIGDSEACACQGFVVGDRITALQFHLESTPESVGLLLEHCGDELDGSAFVQAGADLRGTRNSFDRIHDLHDRVMRFLSNGASGDPERTVPE